MGSTGTLYYSKLLNVLSYFLWSDTWFVLNNPDIFENNVHFSVWSLINVVRSICFTCYLQLSD